jgi:hypothetical protein
MKAIKIPVFYLLSALLFPGLTGCKTHTETQSLSSGYEEISHPNRTPGNEEEPRVSLEYLSPDGQRLLIWPSLFTSDEIIKADVAIFVGDEAYVSSNPNDPRGTKPRLFAVKAPAPPLDITDEVLWYWCRSSGKDFAKAVQLFNVATLTKQGDKVHVQLEFYVNERDWPDSASFQLDWNQISEIMRTVKAKGTMHKDPRWGTPYIQN